MTTPEPLHPLCMAAAQDGTVYAVALAFWTLEDNSLSRDPDFLVALKGSTTSSLAKDLEWTPLTALRRAYTNIMAGQRYSNLCAVSDDQTQFILHFKIEDSYIWDPYPRTFSVRFTLSGPYSNSTEYPRSVMTTDLPSVPTYQPQAPWAMASVKDLAPVNATNATSTPSTTLSLFAEWVRFSTTEGGTECMQSVSGSFSQSPTPIVLNGSIVPNTGYDYVAMAVQEKVLYTLSSSPQLSLLVTPLTSFNSSSALLYPTAQTSTMKVALPNLDCQSPSTAMTVRGSSAYIICIPSNYPPPNPPTFFQVNLLNGSVSQSQLTYANKAIANKKWISIIGPAPSLVAVSDQSFVYTDSMEVPKLYYSIDASGYMDNYTLSNIPMFSSNNMNPNWTSSPLTLSDLASVMVSIAALLLAVLLIWAQEKVLRLRKRTWVDSSDIPGSKVAEEMDEEAFRAYQREEQERVQRYIQKEISRGRQPEQDSFSPYADVTISPQFETSNTRSATTSRDALNESPHSEALGLGRLGFSSHPRPNVMTTIPDEETNDL